MVVVRSVRIVRSMAVGNGRFQCAEQRLDTVDHRDNVRAGLALNVQNHGRRGIHPAA